MNASLRIGVLSLSVLGLAACASTDNRSAYVEPAKVSNPGDVRIVRDEAYIDYVERNARRRGIHLQWVNVPTKRVTNE
ncbi:hypothetical protein [Luteimonas vadosa]|uniref:Uncharacterized protein n=1 Tax=Luteimonas vadosa TaxID=1165507 RepID=A0ABP9E7R9_9GAMM